MTLLMRPFTYKTIATNPTDRNTRLAPTQESSRRQACSDPSATGSGGVQNHIRDDLRLRDH
jgi:hypothetical protein